MSKKIKVTILHNIMAPYKFPLFKFLSKQKKIDLNVLFLSESAINRYWKYKGRKLGFKYKVLPKIALNFVGKDFLTYLINYTFPFEFFRNKFDVLIVHGWLDFAPQIGFLLCKLTGRKYIVWSESSPNEKSWRRTITLPMVKTIVRGANACIAIGTQSKKYFEILGVPPKKIFIAYYTMDLKHFLTKSRLTQEKKLDYMLELGIPKGKIILYVGQFIERKGINYLLSAFKLVQKKYPKTSLLLVGYGPQKNFLMSRVNKEKINNVFFHGHVDVNEMPRMYGMADIFVLPSYEEAWGLVINEAMAAGLPIVTTDKVGAAADLVFNGLNGYVVPAKNSKAIATALKKILSSPALLNRMSKESKKIIRNFSPENTGKGFLKAIDYSLKN